MSSVTTSWGIGDILNSSAKMLFNSPALDKENIARANKIFGVEVTTQFRYKRCGASSEKAVAMFSPSEKEILAAIEGGPKAELLALSGGDLSAVAVAAVADDLSTGQVIAFLNRSDLQSSELSAAFDIEIGVANEIFNRRKTGKFSTLDDVERIKGVTKKATNKLIAAAKSGFLAELAKRKNQSCDCVGDIREMLLDVADGEENTKAGTKKDLAIDKSKHTVTGRKLTDKELKDALSPDPSDALILMRKGRCYQHQKTSVDLNAIKAGSVTIKVNTPVVNADAKVSFDLNAELVGGEDNLGGRIECPEVFCNYDWVSGKVKITGTWIFRFDVSVSPAQLRALGLSAGAGAEATMEWSYNVFSFRHFPTFGIRSDT